MLLRKKDKYIKVKEVKKDVKKEVEVPYRVMLGIGDFYGSFRMTQPSNIEETQQFVSELKKLLPMKVINLDIPDGYEYQAVGIMYVIHKKEGGDKNVIQKEKEGNGKS